MSDMHDRPAGRRAFLGRAAALAFAGGARAGQPGRGPEGFAGLITREKDPPNLEFPFPALDGFITPNERFFIRCHFPVPALDARSWRLRVEGAVRRELELSLDDLRKLPEKTVTATIECAGNSRVFLHKEPGVQWELGAVGNAEWTGVPLAAVLQRAGLAEGAAEAVLEGADRGEVRGPPKSPGVIPFARSLPLTKARRPEVLLAYRMNGKELPKEHGFPLRAVVAGWYGMASVKWLTRVVVTERPFDGFFQTFDYTHWQRVKGLATLVPVTAMQVKAAVARPAPHEVVRAGAAYRVRGAAWAGEAEVAKVEVSTDGGKTWEPARLIGKSAPFAWRLWEHEWRTPAKAGRHVVLARATDGHGRVQPPRHDPDRRTYVISHVLPVEVEVR